MFEGVTLAEFEKLKKSDKEEDRIRFAEKRQRAKAINFGIPGGQGAASLQVIFSFLLSCFSLFFLYHTEKFIFDFNSFFLGLCKECLWSSFDSSRSKAIQRKSYS